MIKEKFIETSLMANPRELRKIESNLKKYVNKFLQDERKFSDVKVEVEDDAIIIDIPIEDAAPYRDEPIWPDPKPWIRYVYNLDVVKEYEDLTAGRPIHKLYWFKPEVLCSQPTAWGYVLEDELVKYLQQEHCFKGNIC